MAKKDPCPKPLFFRFTCSSTIPTLLLASTGVDECGQGNRRRHAFWRGVTEANADGCREAVLCVPHRGGIQDYSHEGQRVLYTVSRLLGPGGGAGAPRNLYVGDLNGIVTVLREHLGDDVVDDIMNRVTSMPIQGRVYVRQGQPLQQMYSNVFLFLLLNRSHI